MESLPLIGNLSSKHLKKKLKEEFMKFLEDPEKKRKLGHLFQLKRQYQDFKN